MKGKKLLHKMIPRMFTIFMVIALCLLSGIGPGIKVYAGEGAPAGDARAAVKNPQYTLTSTNGERISTTANPGETTVLIFGYTECSKTRTTLASVSSSSWVKRSDIRVIFADTRGHSKEEVLAYQEGYQCPYITFCYDESDVLFRVMAAYGSLFGINGGTYPTTVLIDKNNQVQNLLRGKKTADEILDEIKKFENIDENGTGSDLSGSGSEMENYVYGLTSIEGAAVSTKANPNETTVLVFGYTACGYTKSTMQNIAKSSWAGRPDIRVVYADVITAGSAAVSGSALSVVKEYAQNFTGADIIFCYDKSAYHYNIAMKYLSLFGLSGGKYPFIVLIDSGNKVQNILLGPKTADEIIAEIQKFTKIDQATGGNTTDPSTPGNTGSGDTSSGNTGSGNTGSGNMGPGDTGLGNTGSSGTWPGNTEPGDIQPGYTVPGISVPGTAMPGNPSIPLAPTPVTPAPTEPGQIAFEVVVAADGSRQIKDSDGKTVKNQLVTASDGNRYYADENGVAAARKIVSSGHVKYFAKEDGVIAQNEFCTTAKGSTVYAQADGSLAVNKVVDVDGRKYYAKANCALAKDGFFTTAKGSKIYAKASGELAASQIFQVDGKKYYAKPSGALVRNKLYKTAQGDRIYAKASGELAVNQIFQADGRLYCAKASGAIAQKSFYTLPSGERVYAKASGAIAVNQVFSVGGKKYYADKKGELAAGKWVKVGNKRYYCSASYKITKTSKISA